MRYKYIDKYEYVSFDLFDTLIKRDVKNPKDVFKIVEILFNERNQNKISNFYNNRIIAEKKAREAQIDEINYDSIYDNLKENYSDKEIEILKELELEVELKVCNRNIEMYSFYQECLNKHKKIIITTDMYLTIDTIKKILEKNDYNNYYKIYLSSDLKKSKSSGEVFKYIKEDLNSNSIIHFGDNLYADIIKARLNKIKSIKVSTKYSKLNFLNKKVKDDKYLYLQHFMNSRLDNNNSYYYNMGYETLGPLLYGFATWLYQNADDKKVFFLSRDGFMMQKAFNIVTDKKVKSTYFYGSRRALNIPTLWKDDNLEEMLEKVYVRDKISVGKLFSKWGLVEKDYIDILKKHNVSISDIYTYQDLFNEKFKSIFNEIKPSIQKSSKKEYELLIKYIKQESFSNNIMLVDIGWYGSMQLSLSKILKDMNIESSIDGYYFGVNPLSKNYDKIKMHGFLFENKINYDNFIKLCGNTGIFESLFLAPHGSVEKYSENNKKIEPVLYEYEYENTIEDKKYREIQDGAIQFIKDYKESYLSKLLVIDNKLSFYNIEKLIIYPSLKDVKYFGDFKFLDDGISFLAKPKKMIEYLKRPRLLLDETLKCCWSIGLIKRMVKIKFCYYSLYKIAIGFFIKNKIKKENQKII